ncbi:hypothetical protein BDK51DRAFT_38973 [Blyttiomyces helicus]|uniref:C2 domain-containing protein n=1 Tax=Blyttiomyces helicus TaxID=388810 RepID=A0A4P9WM26_9FUNG|nr:hypothetical protein BDK51DRAFT_38973 [Blyttiomyces helicus]|eukprot:RKO93255.1 hypothetical protein BDK51DRAFT_38973 [Blyttiomyces helicus]
MDPPPPHDELVLSLSDVHFARPGHHFLTLDASSSTGPAFPTQRTDVSRDTQRPEFRTTRFRFPYLSPPLTRVVITAHRIDREERAKDEDEPGDGTGAGSVRREAGVATVTVIGDAVVPIGAELKTGWETCSAVFTPREGGPDIGGLMVALSVEHSVRPNPTTLADARTLPVPVKQKLDDNQGYAQLMLARSLVDLSRDEVALDEAIDASRAPVNDSEPVLGRDSVAAWIEPGMQQNHFSEPSRNFPTAVRRDTVARRDPAPDRNAPTADRGTLRRRDTVELRQPAVDREIPRSQSPLEDTGHTDEILKLLAPMQHSPVKKVTPFISAMNPAYPGHRLIVTVHDVWDLPMVINAATGKPCLPVPFVTAKTEREAAEKIPAKEATHVGLPCREASFGEILTLELPDPYTMSYIPTVTFTIADNLTKRLLARFNLPISCTFFPTHRQLNLVLRSVSAAVDAPSPQLRLSIASIDTSISNPYVMQKEYDVQLVTLECFIEGFTRRPLPVPMRVYAVEGYPATFPPLAPSIQLEFDRTGALINPSEFEKEIHVPHLIYNKFRRHPPLRDVEEESAHEFYQMTRCSALDPHPTWHEHFVFQIEMLNLSADTALIVEYYRDAPVTDTSPLHPPTPDHDSAPLRSRPIDDLVAYSLVPIGDFTVLEATDAGKVKTLSDVKVRFLAQHSKLAGTSNVHVSMQIKCPDNWVGWGACVHLIGGWGVGAGITGVGPLSASLID